MTGRPIVAIDGPSGVGKSTVARQVAKRLGFALIDTGALYRAVAWLADGAGVDWSNGVALAKLADAHEFVFDLSWALLVDGEALGHRIRTPRMSRGASAVAKHPEVRASLLGIQRRLGAVGGVVLEGRDIGTVVFPDAGAKFYLNASVRVRAERRFSELKLRGEKITFEEVEREQILRDANDANREISPLRKADDAVEIICDEMNVEQVVEAMLARI
jgi:CMP/dCMP kinase